MATYYVDPLGTDDGSHGTAPGTDAFWSVEYALETGGVIGGNTLYVAPGSALLKSGTDNKVVIPASSGTILLSGYGGDPSFTLPSAGMFYPNQGGTLRLENVILDNADSINNGSICFFNFNNDRTVELEDVIVDGNGLGSRLAQMYGATAGARKLSASKSIIRNFSSASALISQNSSAQIGELNFSSSVIHSGGLFAVGTNPLAVSVVNCTTDNITANTTDSATSSISIVNSIQKTGEYGVGNRCFLKVYDSMYSGINDNNIFNYKNNVIYFYDPLDGDQYHGSIDSNYIIPIDETNWFIDPDFTDGLAGDYSLVSTSKVSARGDSTILPDTDINGDAWKGADVGAFKNPSAIRYIPATVGKAAFVGDSIMAGYSATSGNECYEIFEALSGLQTVTDGTAAIAGIRAEHVRFLVDYSIFQNGLNIAFMACGINNIQVGGLTPSNATDEAIANQIILNMRTLENRGVLPIWLGIGSQYGNPPDNSVVEAVNGYVEAACLQYGWHYTNWYEYMVEAHPSDWATTYYADLTTDVHPNNAGHAKIAEEALYAWLETDPQCAPASCVPVRCKPVRCWPVRCR